jgi:predicted phosphodiesterase
LMQKIAVLSDIHGNIAALEKVVEDIKSRQVDGVFNLGDHVSGPLWPKETLEFLREQDWIQIRGNHERQLTQNDPKNHGLSDRYAYEKLNASDLDWLKALPAGREVQDEFLLFHGTPSSDMAYLLETVEHGRARLATQAEIIPRLDETGPRFMFCGHTHIPRVVELPGNLLIVNPGSVGLPAYEADSPEHHVMETGSPHARYAIVEYRNGSWLAELVAISYDHQKAAEQARRNHRPDWEVGLQMGTMQQG